MNKDSKIIKYIVCLVLVGIVFVAGYGVIKLLNKDVPYENIEFKENDTYAIANLGVNYDFSKYEEEYKLLGVDKYNLEGEEYYLIVPRYEDMDITISEMTIGENGNLDVVRQVYKSDVAKSIIVKCNLSDLYSNVQIELEYDGKKTVISPYLSLKDGEMVVGENGLDITLK